jgi:hypothetical protein
MSDLRTSIMAEVDKTLDDALADRNGSQCETKAAMITYAQTVLDACSTKELESGRALERFLETIKRDAIVMFYNR